MFKRSSYAEMRRRLPSTEELEAVVDSRVRWTRTPIFFLLQGYILVLSSERLWGFCYNYMGKSGRLSFQLPRDGLRESVTLLGESGNVLRVEIDDGSGGSLDLLLDPRRAQEARRIRRACTGRESG